MQHTTRTPEINLPGIAYSLVLDSPLGRLGVCLQGSAVSRIDHLPPHTSCRHSDRAPARHVAGELQRYFSDPGHVFDLSLELRGTPFQLRVWRALQDIPFGETRSYGQLAAELGSGARAVGNACRNNPVTIVVPCHRVVAAGGLGGYSGRTRGPELGRKAWLLEHEGVLPGDLKNRRATPIHRRHPELARSSQA